MAIISFCEGTSDAVWAVAGWAFRQLLADVRVRYPEDSQLGATFDEAEACGYLQLGFLDQALAATLSAAIQETANLILSGKIRSGIGERFRDEEATQEYFKGLRMLLDAAQIADERPAC